MIFPGMSKIRENKAAGVAVIAAVYVAAALLGTMVYFSLRYPFWLRLLEADAAATLLVFLFSLLLRNASVYDPYWSVQPVVIVTGYVISHGLTAASALLLISVLFWGFRLTANWLYTFSGLGHQDWRYTMLKERTGVFYPVVNLMGIHLFPTLVVYCCTLPAVFVIESGAKANAWSLAGTVVCLSAALLQLIADMQMHRFRREGSGGLIRTGLWKHARHPNYLGEILMWWGIAVQAVGVMPQRWWLTAGALINTLMFLVISIPMADRRQSEKPGYDEYRCETRSLMPFPKRRG